MSDSLARAQVSASMLGRKFATAAKGPRSVRSCLMYPDPGDAVTGRSRGGAVMALTCPACSVVVPEVTGALGEERHLVSELLGRA